MTQELADSDFTVEVLEQKELPVLVDFFGPSCGPCNQLSPLIDTLAEKTKGFAKVFKMNVQKNPETAAAYGIRAVPTVIVFDQGEERARFHGVQHPKHYLDALGLEY